jgi:hypothetical protein
MAGLHHHHETKSAMPHPHPRTPVERPPGSPRRERLQRRGAIAVAIPEDRLGTSQPSSFDPLMLIFGSGDELAEIDPL